MAEAIHTGTLSCCIEEKLKMAQNKFFHRSNDTAMANIVSAVVFCIFSFVYLYFYQDDLLTMEQHVLSNGLTQYNRIIGAILLTGLLCILQIIIDALTKKCIKYPAMNYFPSALLLAILTDISPNIDQGYSFGKWEWLAPIIIILYIMAAYVSASMLGNNDGPERKSQAQIIWENLMIMAIFMTFICATANTNRAFHDRIRIENLIAQDKFNEALKVKGNENDADSSTTMLRAYALSKTGQLAEKLFEYDICGGSDALLPNGKTTKCLLYSDTLIFRHVAEPMKQKCRAMTFLRWMKKHGYAKKKLEDYLLCGYLMDRDLDSFAKELAKDKLNHKKLPQAYREALLLYNHVRSTPIISYKNEVMEADYIDLQTILKTTPDEKSKKYLARKSYGNTYWYYYLYGDGSKNDKEQ